MRCSRHLTLRSSAVRITKYFILLQLTHAASAHVCLWRRSGGSAGGSSAAGSRSLGNSSRGGSSRGGGGWESDIEIDMLQVTVLTTAVKEAIVTAPFCMPGLCSELYTSTNGGGLPTSFFNRCILFQETSVSVCDTRNICRRERLPLRRIVELFRRRFRISITTPGTRRTAPTGSAGLSERPERGVQAKTERHSDCVGTTAGLQRCCGRGRLGRGKPIVCLPPSSSPTTGEDRD